jgi:hypothetical protein
MLHYTILITFRVVQIIPPPQFWISILSDVSSDSVIPCNVLLIIFLPISEFYPIPHFYLDQMHFTGPHGYTLPLQDLTTRMICIIYTVVYKHTNWDVDLYPVDTFSYLQTSRKLQEQTLTSYISSKSSEFAYGNHILLNNRKTINMQIIWC